VEELATCHSYIDVNLQRGHPKLTGKASTASTATPRMHEADAVPTRVLRNETTPPSMCAILPE